MTDYSKSPKQRRPMRLAQLNKVSRRVRRNSGKLSQWELERARQGQR